MSPQPHFFCLRSRRQLQGNRHELRVHRAVATDKLPIEFGHVRMQPDCIKNQVFDDKRPDFIFGLKIQFDVIYFTACFTATSKAVLPGRSTDGCLQTLVVLGRLRHPHNPHVRKTFVRQLAAIAGKLPVKPEQARFFDTHAAVRQYPSLHTQLEFFIKLFTSHPPKPGRLAKKNQYGESQHNQQYDPFKTPAKQAHRTAPLELDCNRLALQIIHLKVGH